MKGIQSLTIRQEKFYPLFVMQMFYYYTYNNYSQTTGHHKSNYNLPNYLGGRRREFRGYCTTNIYVTTNYINLPISYLTRIIFLICIILYKRVNTPSFHISIYCGGCAGYDEF